ncbi:MAG: hypothetical protein U9N49_00990, partial [Campylobacterota bacterium]|nr:hypothetical protein [Campylobacterota bacterium]
MLPSTNANENNHSQTNTQFSNEINMTKCYTMRDVVGETPSNNFHLEDNIIGMVILGVFIVVFFLFKKFAIYLPIQERLLMEAETLNDTLLKQKVMQKAKQNSAFSILHTGSLMAGWRMLHLAKIDDIDVCHRECIIEELRIAQTQLLQLQESKQTKALNQEITRVLLEAQGTAEVTQLKELSKTSQLDILFNKIEQILEKRKNDLTLSDILETLVEKIKELKDNPQMNEDQQTTLKDEIDKLLQRIEDNSGVTTYQLKILLKRTKEIYYEQRDDYYEILADWQNRSTLLILLAVILIFILLMVEDNTLLLAAGAIGGLLSKLRGVIKSLDTPTSYGFSWSTLWLMPLIGVLTGWAGVYSVIVLKDMELFGNLLFTTLQQGQECSTPTLIILAISFGYLANLFEKMISKVESFATKEKNQ